MHDSKLWKSSRWLGSGSARAAGVVLIAVTGTAGCGGDNSAGATPDGGTGDGAVPLDGSAPQEGGNPPETGAPETGGDGGNSLTTVIPVANGAQFSGPMDSTPDPTGATIYFTAMAADGTSGVFSAPATANATVTKLFSGDPLVSPFGIAISADGATLFIADAAASTANDGGGIYSMPAGGGTPTLLGGTDGVTPKSLEVVGMTLYFTGIDKANGKPGVFSTPAGGGAVTTVAEGAPFVDPSGVTADAAGTVYVIDSLGAATQHAAVIQVKGGTASSLVADLVVGYPAGIALSPDGTTLFASALDPVHSTDQVLEIQVANGDQTINTSGPIGANFEAAGLHRAHSAPVYSWADSTAGGTGTVYLLKR